MGNIDPTTSRRALLGVLTVSTIAAARPTWPAALAKVRQGYGDDPVTLIRTPAGRALSRARYRRAEEFLPDASRDGAGHRQFLYRAGIAAQLGLSAHLLDVGFPDAWCARQIGLRVAKSLTYANATGLGHFCPDMARLADVLSPYRKWNEPVLIGAPQPDDGGFSPRQIEALLRTLLDHVRSVTGYRHPRPAGSFLNA